MKKILCLFISVILIFTFSGCSLLNTVKSINDAASANSSAASDIVSDSAVSSSASSDSSVTSDSSSTVSGASDTLTFYGLKMQVPEGFEINNTTTENPMIQSKDYPNVADNINFIKMGVDNISSYSKEVFEDAYKGQFEGFTFKSYDVVKISGIDTIRMNYSLTVSDITIEQIQYMIFASDASYVVTLTICEDTYRTVFENAVNGIQISAI